MKLTESEYTGPEDPFIGLAAEPSLLWRGDDLTLLRTNDTLFVKNISAYTY